MKRIIIIIFCFFILTSVGWGQVLINEYYPFHLNVKKYYVTDNGDTLIVSYLTSQRSLNEINYIVEKESRRNNSAELSYHESYYRLDSGNIYITQEGQKRESLFLPFQPVIGETWLLSDNGWQWKIVSLDAVFTTRLGEFTSLLKIQEFDLEIPEDTAIYFSYFKKGVGLIARTRNNKIETEYIGQD